MYVYIYIYIYTYTCYIYVLHCLQKMLADFQILVPYRNLVLLIFYVGQ